MNLEVLKMILLVATIGNGFGIVFFYDSLIGLLHKEYKYEWNLMGQPLCFFSDPRPKKEEIFKGFSSLFYVYKMTFAPGQTYLDLEKRDKELLNKRLGLISTIVVGSILSLALVFVSKASQTIWTSKTRFWILTRQALEFLPSRCSVGIPSFDVLKKL